MPSLIGHPYADSAGRQRVFLGIPCHVPDSPRARRRGAVGVRTSGRRSCVDRASAERVEGGAVNADHTGAETAGGELPVVDPLLDDARRNLEFGGDFRDT
ncbi:hypothetical protein W7U_06265 [Mycobacterium sp. H4Y]|nr:hypothetical protein W7S_10495 [Mycobacterium sp. MOTT36Y]ELR84813.1 hypothetical protein W7U_06265 [Mycobacterium sp. H4Y]